MDSTSCNSLNVLSSLSLSRDGWTEQEKEVVAEYRWWAADELKSTTETSWPEKLLDMLRRLP